MLFPGVYWISQKIQIWGFSPEQYFPVYQSILWCFFLPFPLPSNLIIYAPKSMTIKHKWQYPGWEKLLIFVHFSLPVTQEHFVTILQMRKLRHVMVQELSIRSPILYPQGPEMDPLGVLLTEKIHFFSKKDFFISTSRSILLPREQHPCCSFSQLQQIQQILRTNKTSTHFYCK